MIKECTDDAGCADGELCKNGMCGGMFKTYLSCPL